MNRSEKLVSIFEANTDLTGIDFEWDVELDDTEKELMPDGDIDFAIYKVDGFSLDLDGSEDEEFISGLQKLKRGSKIDIDIEVKNKSNFIKEKIKGMKVKKIKLMPNKRLEVEIEPQYFRIQDHNK